MNNNHSPNSTDYNFFAGQHQGSSDYNDTLQRIASDNFTSGFNTSVSGDGDYFYDGNTRDYDSGNFSGLQIGEFPSNGNASDWRIFPNASTEWATITDGPQSGYVSSVPTDLWWSSFSSTMWPSIVPDGLDYTSVDGEQVGAEETEFNWWFLLLLGFIFAGGLGNILVCLAICLERRLQNMTNYFLLSLAVADLLVSLVVMPFGLVTLFAGYWPFGAAMCNVYVTCDVLACSSSIMHMCFISVGRYLGIRNPLKTRGHSKKAVVFKIVLVWLLAMVITSPITLLGLVDNSNILPIDHACAINNKFFFIFGSLFAFYIPMVFMVVAYILTVQLLRQQAKFGDQVVHARRLHPLPQPPDGRTGSGRRSSKLRSSTSSSSSSLSWGHGGQSPATPSSTRDNSGMSTRSTTTNNGHLSFVGLDGQRGGRTKTVDRGTQTKITEKRRPSPRFQLTKSASSVHFKFLPDRLSRQQSRRSMKGSSSVATEQKASKVLGLVFFTFVVCWAPFFILNVIFAACPTCPVSDRIGDTCLWLGYVSSTINPIIYTIFNRTFKEAFISLLTCRCVGRKRRRWGPGIGAMGSGLLGGGRHYSASEGLAHAPIKIIGCLRSPTFPPPTASKYSDQRETEIAVSEC